MLHLQTFGAVDLRRPTGASVGSLLAQPRTTALLVYLVLARPRGFQRRDTLCALFWPESDDEHARGSLSQALSRIRRSVGPHVIELRGKEELCVAPGTLTCDVVRFEEALDAGDPTGALDLYRGPFLAGFHAGHMPGFESWLDTERNRLRVLAAGAARELTAERIRGDRLPEAARAAARSLAIAPESEAVAAELVQALADAGDRAGALALYDAWAGTLAREFDIEPSAEVQALAGELRESAALPPGAPIPGSEVSADMEAGPAAGTDPSGLRSPAADPTSETTPRIPLRAPAAGGFFRRRTALGTVAVLVLLLVSWGALKTGLLSAEFPVQASGRVAAGLASGDWLVVADFTGPPADSALPLAVQTLLSRAVGSAGYATLVGGLGALTRRGLEDVLARMRLPPDTRVDADLGCQIAEREGAAGVLAGRVLPLGDKYVIDTSILGGGDCQEMVHASAVASFEELSEAVTAVARELRSRLGESRASIRSSPPLPPITAAHIEALRSVMRYVNTPGLWNDSLEGAAPLLEAIRIEPDFGFAHFLLALHYQRLDRFEDALPQFRRAYESRDQLSREGRLGMEAIYQRYIASDPRAAMATIEAIPADAPGLADATMPFLADAALWLGDWEKALDISRAFLGSRPTGLAANIGYTRGAAAAWALGRDALADSLFRAVPAPDPNLVLLQLLRHRDWRGAEAMCARHPTWDRCGYLELARGKLRAAAAVLGPVLRGQGPSGQKGNRAAALAALVHLQVLRGQPDSAWLLLSRANPTMPPEGPARAVVHLSRFLTCAAAAELHRSERLPGCRLEGEDPADWDADPSFKVLLRSGAWSRRLLAVRSLERGAAGTALQQERAAVQSNFGNPGTVDHLLQALAFDALDRPDSALAHYVAAARIERDVGFPTAAAILLPLAPVYRRIGELAEAAGDPTTALEYYGAFVDLWADADPALQRQVRAVREHMHGLVEMAGAATAAPGRHGG